MGAMKALPRPLFLYVFLFDLSFDHVRTWMSSLSTSTDTDTHTSLWRPRCFQYPTLTISRRYDPGRFSLLFRLAGFTATPPQTHKHTNTGYPAINISRRPCPSCPYFNTSLDADTQTPPVWFPPCFRDIAIQGI